MGIGLKKYQNILSAPSHRLPDDYSLLGPYARRDHMLCDYVPLIGYVYDRLPPTPAKSKPTLRGVSLGSPPIQ